MFLNYEFKKVIKKIVFTAVKYLLKNLKNNIIESRFSNIFVKGEIFSKSSIRKYRRWS